MYKALLLNGNYQALQFVTDRKAILYLLKNKVEVLSEWNEICFDKTKYPAVLRLNYHVKKPPRKASYSRFAVFRRDNYTCQYCGKCLRGKNITVDHIVPKVRGGKNTFLNCVTSCYPCNNGKRDKTLEQAGLKLLREPFAPTVAELTGFDNANNWHESWEFYLGDAR